MTTIAKLDPSKMLGFRLTHDSGRPTRQAPMAPMIGTKVPFPTDDTRR